MSVTDDRLRAVIADQALEWHLRQREGELSAAARAEFMDWLRASPLNVREYLELASLTQALPHALAAVGVGEGSAGVRQDGLMDDASGAAQTPSNVLQLSDFHVRRVDEAPNRSVARRVSLFAAAAAVAVIGVGLYAWHSGYLGVMGILPIAAPDSQIAIVLRDGSRLHLNAGSRVRVHFSRGERLLDLEAGEVLFDVAHDRSRPFRVRAGSADVIAVGTRFDVNRLATAVVVTVVEGKVDVVDAVMNASGSAGVADHMPPLRVAAGERVEVGADGQPSATQPIDTHIATAWMRHDIAFSSKPLSDVTDELNRYLEKPIVIQDDGLRTLRISGIFNAYDAESFLAFLRQYDVEIDARDNVVYVRARPKPAPASTRATIARSAGRGDSDIASQ